MKKNLQQPSELEDVETITAVDTAFIDPPTQKFSLDYKSPWISFKKKLPPNKTTVLLYKKQIKRIWTLWYEGGCGDEVECASYNDDYWMPLPEPPEQK